MFGKTLFFRRAQAGLIGLLSSGAVLGATYVAPSHEAAAQLLISNLDLHEQFLEQRERYLEFLKGSGASAVIVKHLGDQLKLTNVLAHMTGFVAAQFAEAELEPINAYLETGVGRKEYQLVLALVKERRRAAPGTLDVNARIAAFQQSLSPQDRAAADAFRASPPGQKYWSRLDGIDKKLTEVFTKRCEDILERLAANATKPDAAQPSGNKSP